jgi:arylsulfatase A-like enzyme
VPPGWTRWYAHLGNAQYYYDYRTNVDGNKRYAAPGEYSTDDIAQESSRWIAAEARAAHPFFAWVAPLSPHLPATPAPRHAALLPDLTAPRYPSFDEDVSDKPTSSQLQPLPLSAIQIAAIDSNYRMRQRALMSLDELVARILDSLDATGATANTYVIYSSDNGWHQGEHRRMLSKNTAYEFDVHVPLYVRGPTAIAGLHRQEIVLNIDFAPTVASFAQVSVPNPVDGRSFASLVAGGSGGSWRRWFLIESHLNDPEKRAVRSHRMKYIEWRNGARELYDLETDPDEMTNIAALATPTVLRWWHARLVDLQQCAASTCYTAERPH